MILDFALVLGPIAPAFIKLLWHGRVSAKSCGTLVVLLSSMIFSTARSIAFDGNDLWRGVQSPQQHRYSSSSRGRYNCAGLPKAYPCRSPWGVGTRHSPVHLTAGRKTKYLSYRGWPPRRGERDEIGSQGPASGLSLKVCICVCCYYFL